MGIFKVSEKTEAELRSRMERLGILESDLEERFIRGSGKGGQKINKTSSTVQLIHRPSGIEVRCQRERSQAMNRFYARRELCDRLEAKILGIASRKRQEVEKIRRQKRRRSRRGKEKMLEGKRKRAESKAGRKKVVSSDY